MKLLLKISFLGTGYCGYQVQPNKNTIQSEMNKASKSIFGFDCDIVGCSRTDSGVHANEFYVCVSEKKKNILLTNIPTEKIPAAYNSILPPDISVEFASFIDSDFHPRYDVKKKEYIYKIWNREFKNPFESDRAFMVKKIFSDDDVERMNIGAQYFLGKHDFVSFMAKGSKIVDTNRTVYKASVKKKGNYIVFCVSANGFLYNMVRIMCGTLLLVGYNKISPEDILKIINLKDRKYAGITVPPCGLYLNKVIY